MEAPALVRGIWGSPLSNPFIKELLYINFINNSCRYWRQIEADADPDDVDVIYNHLNVPVLFLFAQPETLLMDRSTAETLALKLRGEIGLVLINRWFDPDSLKSDKDLISISFHRETY